MKKLIFILTLFFGIHVHSHAQLMIGGHLGPAFPFGEFSDAVNLGFGLGAEGKYIFNETIAFGFDVSWYSFDTGIDEIKENLTPFLFSVEYLIPQTSGFTPYAGLGLGLYRVATRIKVSGFRSTESYTNFGIAPTLGALYPLNDQIDLNVNLKFNFVFTEEETIFFIPLNAGVVFRIL
jgi:opacity protein-like surface antigen